MTALSWNRLLHRTAILLALAACALGIAASQPARVNAGAPQSQTKAAPAPQQENALVIENDFELRDTYRGEQYEVRLTTHRGENPLHWKLEKGTLPPGIKLEENGMLHGAAESAGEFQFTVSVGRGDSRDGVQKQFLIRVRSALTINWKSAAKVNGGRIEGSVLVSNTTPDDMDLTFDVKAVAENGRATEIGYQHFLLRRGTTEKELPFGENLPHGGYVVYVNAVGEVAPKNLIYRERMQTAGPLQVAVGP